MPWITSGPRWMRTALSVRTRPLSWYPGQLLGLQTFSLCRSRTRPRSNTSIRLLRRLDEPALRSEHAGLSHRGYRRTRVSTPSLISVRLGHFRHSADATCTQPIPHMARIGEEVFRIRVIRSGEEPPTSTAATLSRSFLQETNIPTPITVGMRYLRHVCLACHRSYFRERTVVLSFSPPHAT